MDFLEIKVIGVGGVGTALVDKLSQFLNFLDGYQSKMTLIDGDEFESKNEARQAFSTFGNKARVKMNEISSRYGDNVRADSIQEYVTEDSAKELILENDVVMMCVDNHKTRKIVSDHCSSLNNVVLISGGNEFEDGNVQIHIRKEGRNVTPPITDYHPEIENPQDKPPYEMSCQELEEVEPQLLFTNLSVASIMCWAFYNTVVNQRHEVSEVYFDMVSMNADSKIRQAKS